MMIYGKPLTKEDVDHLAMTLKEAIDKGEQVALSDLSREKLQRPVGKGWIKVIDLYVSSYSYRKKPKSIVDRIKTYICE